MYDLIFNWLLTQLPSSFDVRQGSVAYNALSVIATELSNNNFGVILARMLSMVSDSFDKRQGSIIYDTLSPSATLLAQAAINTEIYADQTYLGTATGVNLDRRAADSAISRYPATQAIRIAEMLDQTNQPVDINIGDRFATPSETGGIIFRTVERVELGIFLLECEIPGTLGNEYYGDILPLQINNQLGRSTITGTQIPARDVESDDDFRERVKERISETAFAGNVADYRRFTRDIDGVGDLKVFPIWNGGGTVLLSVLDGSYNTITTDFQRIIKNIIDPEIDTGQGIGVAPIGHRVTVTTPNRLTINVRATVTLEGRTIGQIQELAEQGISDYFLSIRQTWSDNGYPRVFNIAVANAIYDIQGVINVRNVELNGSYNDISLILTPEYQELPYLGVVTLVEA